MFKHCEFQQLDKFSVERWGTRPRNDPSKGLRGIGSYKVLSLEYDFLVPFLSSFQGDTGVILYNFGMDTHPS